MSSGRHVNLLTLSLVVLVHKICQDKFKRTLFAPRKRGVLSGNDTSIIHKKKSRLRGGKLLSSIEKASKKEKP